MGLLALAGMVSGAGEGMKNAASQAMTFIGTSALQKQRDDMEARRLQLMEDSQTAREQRGYQHTEAMQASQQAFAREQQQDQFAHADTTLGNQQAFEAKENDLTRQQHQGDQLQARDIAERTLANSEENTRNDKEHRDATTRIAQAQLDAEREKATLQLDANTGTFVRVSANGKVLGAAINPDTGKPLQGTKDLPATTKLLVDVNKTMIQYKGEQLKNPSLTPEERAQINQEINALRTNIGQLLGEKPQRQGPAKIVDPTGNATASGSTRAEEYLAEMRHQTAQRAAALKSSMQQMAQAAMDAEKPGMAVAAVPPIQPASPPAEPMSRMERQVPPRMQQPGEASDPTGMISFTRPKKPVKLYPPPPLPRELPRAGASTSLPPVQEPEYFDQTMGGSPAPPVDPLTAFATTQPANVPRELPRATPPKGMIAAVREPDIIDPDGTQAMNDGAEPAPTDFDGQQATQDAITTDAGAQSQPAGRRITRPISPDNLRSLLTSDQKLAIAKMQERVLKPGKTEKPATPGQLQDLLIKIMGPLYRDNGQGPGDLAEGVEQMMNTLLPDRKTRR